MFKNWKLKQIKNLEKVKLQLSDYKNVAKIKKNSPILSN